MYEQNGEGWMERGFKDGTGGAAKTLITSSK